MKQRTKAWFFLFSAFYTTGAMMAGELGENARDTDANEVGSTTSNTEEETQQWIQLHSDYRHVLQQKITEVKNKIGKLEGSITTIKKESTHRQLKSQLNARFDELDFYRDTYAILQHPESQEWKAIGDAKRVWFYVEEQDISGEPVSTVTYAVDYNFGSKKDKRLHNGSIGVPSNFKSEDIISLLLKEAAEIAIENCQDEAPDSTRIIPDTRGKDKRVTTRRNKSHRGTRMYAKQDTHRQALRKQRLYNGR